MTDTRIVDITTNGMDNISYDWNGSRKDMSDIFLDYIFHHSHEGLANIKTIEISIQDIKP